jgi:hypothetical protein
MRLEDLLRGATDPLRFIMEAGGRLPTVERTKEVDTPWNDFDNTANSLREAHPYMGPEIDRVVECVEADQSGDSIARGLCELEVIQAAADAADIVFKQFEA